MAFRQLASRLRAGYYKSLDRYPYLMQSVQVSILMGASDLIAQTVVERRTLNEIYLRRTFEFSCLGFCLVGPCLRFWYGKLDRLAIKNPWKKTTVKVLCDQLLFAPIFTGIFISSISFIQGNNLPSIIKRLREEYPSILLTNYMIWPAAQIINFRLIPLNYQVIFVQLVAIIWNTYLSLKLGQKSVK